VRLLTFCTFMDLATVPTFAQTRTGNVEMNGLKPSLKFEQVVKGFLTSLNDKLKLRATEVEFAPRGSLGDHLHIGPGIRYVATGELTVTDDSGKEQVAKAGEYFYESGDKSLKVTNRGSAPAKLIVFELLPADWSGSAMAPVSRRNELELQGQMVEKSICSK